MLNTLIIDEKNKNSRELESKLKKFCPILDLKGIVNKEAEFAQMLEYGRIHLVFLNPNTIASERVLDPDLFGLDKALICISNNYDFLGHQEYWQSVGYLIQPVKEDELIFAVEEARKRIFRYLREQDREDLISNLLKNNYKKEIIGVPTIEGFEIISVTDIIRCEGLQKCTRIITTHKVDIVSSYNIGMFKKLLNPFNIFFSPHRSHIINVNFVKKYKKSGIIVLYGNANIPISKNKKEDFLKQFSHI